MRRGLLATWLIAAALHSAPLGAQPGAAEPAPEPAPGIKVDRDFMVGFWSDREDCGDLVEFLPGGAFVRVGDGDGGSWRLEGDMLTLTAGAEAVARIVPRSRDEITVVNEDGSLGYSRRCPAPPPGGGASPIG
jgi:hypothetical protein